MNFFARMLFTVKVEGESGWPELVPEKYYFASNLFKPRIGDFIVFRHPQQQSEILIKKITQVHKEKEHYSVAGTVSWSSSGEHVGIVHKAHIMGRLIRPLAE